MHCPESEKSNHMYHMLSPDMLLSSNAPFTVFHTELMYKQSNRTRENTQSSSIVFNYSNAIKFV